MLVDPVQTVAGIATSGRAQMEVPIAGGWPAVALPKADHRETFGM